MDNGTGRYAAPSLYPSAVPFLFGVLISPLHDHIADYFTRRSKLTGTINTATSYSDNSVQSGQTYVYTVTSADSKNSESAPSAPVTVTVPSN
jgi:hypothetical protein